LEPFWICVRARLQACSFPGGPTPKKEAHNQRLCAPFLTDWNSCNLIPDPLQQGLRYMYTMDQGSVVVLCRSLSRVIISLRDLRHYLYYSRLNPAVTTSDPRSKVLAALFNGPVVQRLWIWDQLEGLKPNS